MRRVFTGLLVLMLGACNGNPSDSNYTDPRISGIDTQTRKIALQSIECWFENPNAGTETDCFYMHVPQDYDAPEGLWIAFPVLRIVAEGHSSQGEPVLHLGGGGPGGPMGILPGEDLEWIWDRYFELVEETDSPLYLIDPRGVGMANPALNCPEYAEMIEPVLALDLGVAEENARALAALDDCRVRLESTGVDLSRYNSLMVARDVEQLRRALDVEKWNLYGVSYATRYAQVIAREYPDSVSSMVLDAATFPNILYAERSGDDLMLTFGRLFDYCERNPSCIRKLENPEERFWMLAEQLNREPLDFEFLHPFKSEWMAVKITGNRLLNAWFHALYYAESYDLFADTILSLEEGELGPFDTAIYDWIYFLVDTDYAEAAAIAHYCHEELAFTDLRRALDNLKVLPDFFETIAVAELEAAFEQCGEWGIPPAGEMENRAIETAVPTLFLHGTLDPVLPVEDIEEQMNTFFQSELLLFPELSHTVVGFDDCGTQAARSFFQNKLAFRNTLECEL